MSQRQGPPRTGAAVAAATVAAAALIAQQVAGKAVRDALFLASYDVQWLPAAMMLGSATALLAVLALSTLLPKSGPARVLPNAVALNAAALVGLWALSGVAPRQVAALLYFQVALFGATLVSGFWSLVNESFDPYTAKKVVGRIGTGASLGGVAGGLVAFAVAQHLPVSRVLLLLAALNLLAFVALLQLRRTSAALNQAPGGTGETELLGGLRLLGEHGYLRLLASVVAVLALGEAFFDFALKSAAATRFTDANALLYFFAGFHTCVGVVALLLQAFVARRSLATFGLAGNVALVPLALLAGGLAGLVAPLLVTAALAAGGQQVLRNSLYRSGYELLFAPLAEERKRASKAIIDVGFDKLGSLAGGVVVQIAVAVGPSSSWELVWRTLFALAAATGVAALSVLPRIHRGYIGSLEESLRSGAVRLDPSEVLDSTTRFTLAQSGLALDRGQLLQQIEALRGAASEPAAPAAPAEAAVADPLVHTILELRSADGAVARRALLESGELEPRLVAHAIPLLGRNELYLEAVQALRRVADRAAGQLVDALLDPQGDPVVRRRLPRALRGAATEHVAFGLRLGLGCEPFEVRQQCALALTRISDRDPTLKPPAAEVFERVRAELRALPAAGSPELDRRLEHVFSLLALTLEREPLRIAYWAVRSRDTLRGTALEYLDNVLPDDVRQALWPALGVGARRPAPEAIGRRQLREVADELVRTGQFTIDRRLLETGDRDEDA